jgi:GNAT superfamily N-acetyltransferase
VENLIVDEELITSSGALSVYHAAIDELNRRYEGSDEGFLLKVDELLPPRGIFLVARVEGHPAGGVGLRSIVEPEAMLGEIKRLWVRPDQRQRGVAAALMAEIEVRARSRGYRQLYLETGYAQPEALALYEKIGWSRVDEYPADAFSYPIASRFTKVL